MLLNALLAISALGVVSGSCPFLKQGQETSVVRHNPHFNEHHAVDYELYTNALKTLPIEAVQRDIRKLLHSSEDYWPSDWDGNYGPFFIRLAWHTSGSYRTSDGRGGVEGGRQRFEPEESWPDNTNLDKARHLLWPIKEKYGIGLSWGDLFILTGTTAIEDMGGPVLGFCAGRKDDKDGSASVPLGPTDVQQKLAPCEVNGKCDYPLGATTVGLIYVNPEGPMGQPIPEESAPEVRDTFARMGMNDTETVALIGGGHAFGKAHGACPDGAGPSPSEDPSNPWPGLCGTGKGNDTFTSGFEGPWTSSPTQWDNEYFHNLLNYDWNKVVGPGGHYQWEPTAKAGSSMVPPQGVMMLTSDVSLLFDPSYKALVNEFSKDKKYFEEQFSHAWYKLTTRDMGPVQRCYGSMVPPAQPWQFPLPPAPVNLPDFAEVKKAIETVIVTPSTVLASDDGNYGPLFVRTAWQCANTFRQTDYLGGCNGARLRLEPQISWPANAALDSALLLLQPVKDQFGADLTWADLIVLAGTTALELSSGCCALQIPFTGGRSDAIAGEGLPTPDFLQFYLTGGAASDSISTLQDAQTMLGLSSREMVALIGGGHSLGRLHKSVSGFEDGKFTSNPLSLDNEYFKNLVDLTWTRVTGVDADHEEYTSTNPQGEVLHVLKTDMMLVWSSLYRVVVEEYSLDNAVFLADFVSVWVKVMNSDMF